MAADKVARYRPGNEFVSYKRNRALTLRRNQLFFIPKKLLLFEIVAKQAKLNTKIIF